MTDNTQPQPKDEVSALARGLAVLRVVSQASKPLSNRELAEATGIPKATVSRLAATLVGAGYLRQLADSERFSLSATLLELSNAYLRNFDLRSHARPHLAELAEQAGAAVHLGVRDGLDIVLIDHIRPRSAVILSNLDVGSRMAIATSASGRAYLASADEPERQALLDSIRAASGSGWRALKPQLEAALQEHARLGYCASFGEWHHDIHALGLTLRGPRGELYAVSCGGPGYLLPKKLLVEKIAPFLLKTVRAISDEAGTSR
ncbi:IclR family transcriptional regulator [Variovorax terrae]|uniref:IclR family transcriptional regulator n=1 Tax=Variovorax terrae TaxID=2923278 RepID=A0A9X1VUT8_9BURK|nr:IclR family transcriptional regulator [Variovorax terrae]MCJ0763675.1 IclR family transcriptional regulator [Variovorax terrae]